MGSNSEGNDPASTETLKYRIRWGNAALALAGLAALIVALTLPLGGDKHATSQVQDDFWTGPGARPTLRLAPTGPTAAAAKPAERSTSRARERKPERKQKPRKRHRRSAERREPSRPPTSPTQPPARPPPQPVSPTPSPNSVDREFGF